LPGRLVDEREEVIEMAEVKHSGSGFERHSRESRHPDKSKHDEHAESKRDRDHEGGDR
jgi:hypothetical protein